MFTLSDNYVVSNIKFFFFLLVLLFCPQALPFGSGFEDKHFIECILFISSDSFVFGEPHSLEQCHSVVLNGSLDVGIIFWGLGQLLFFDISRHCFQSLLIKVI